MEGGEGGEETAEGSSTESGAASIGGAATRGSIEIWLCRAGLPWPNDGDRCSLCSWACLTPSTSTAFPWAVAGACFLPHPAHADWLALFCPLPTR